ncbi:MAG: beta strand repeat-containing protein, partial [Planctomycetaceae bacterium]
VDTTNFTNGKLTATLAAAKTGDVLQIISGAQTQTPGAIFYQSLTATTGNVFYGLDQIGSVSLTSSALTVTLNANATQTATQALARSIGYQSTANAFLANDTRVVRLVLNDGFSSSANSNTVSVTVNITDVNDAPVLGPVATTTVSYTENGAPVQVQNALTVNDPDLFLRTETGNFGGATLTVSLPSSPTAGFGTASDVLNIGAIGGVTVSAANSSNSSSRTVSVGGVEVGTVLGGVGTTPLVVTWNSAATLDRIQLVGRAVTFSNVSDNPATHNREVRFSLTEVRDSAVSNTVTRGVVVAAVNDAPAIAFTAGTAQTYTEDGSPVLVLADASFAITDVDNGSFNNGALQVTIKAGGATTDRLTVVAGNGVTLGTGANAAQVFYNIGGTPTLVGTLSSVTASTSLKITFNSAATVAAVNAVAKQVGYSTTSQDPSPATSRTIGFTFFDGLAWNTGGEAVQPVAVQPVNDAPVVKLATTVGSWTEQAVAVLVDSLSTITDVDTAILNGGVLTVSLASEIGGNSPQVGFVVSADDQLSIISSTTNAGVKVVGSDVQVWDATAVAFVSVGTLSGAGTSTSPLVVTFNANATVARVQLVARAVAFRSLPANADNPTPGQRAVTFTLSDGDTNVATNETSATSLTVARIINVVARNDNATLTGLAAVTTTRAVPALLAASGVVADPDSPNFGAGYLRVELSAGMVATDVLEIAPGLGFSVDEFNMVTYTTTGFSGVIGTQTVNSTTKQLQIDFMENVSPTVAQALVRAIRYRSTATAQTTAATKTVRWTLSDGDAEVGQTPLAYTQSLRVNP